MAKRTQKWIVILYDGEYIFAVHGPFGDREAALVWAKVHGDRLAPQILQLWHPSEVDH